MPMSRPWIGAGQRRGAWHWGHLLSHECTNSANSKAKPLTRHLVGKDTTFTQNPGWRGTFPRGALGQNRAMDASPSHPLRLAGTRQTSEFPLAWWLVCFFFFLNMLKNMERKKCYRLNNIYNAGMSCAEYMSVMYNLNLYPWQNEIIT